MKLHHLTLTVEQLRKIPNAERALFIVLAHALNEINSLNKLLFLCSRLEDMPAFKAHAHLTQAMMLARVLHGKLNEVWVVITEGYFSSKLGIEYTPLLDESGSIALADLKKYFGRTNVINTVRKQFAFHYSLTHANTSIPEDTPPEELAIYLHETDGASLYYFAEFLMRKSLLETIAPGNTQTSDDPDAEIPIQRFFKEMSSIVAAMNGFSQSFLFLIIDKHVGREELLSTARDINVADVPESDDVQIPYFIKVSTPKAAAK